MVEDIMVEDIYGILWRMVTLDDGVRFEWKETNSHRATWKQEPEHLIPSSIIDELKAQQGDSMLIEVIKKSAPFGTYYKLQVTLPCGATIQTVNQKSSASQWDARVGQLKGAGMLVNFADMPERWRRVQ